MSWNYRLMAHEHKGEIYFKIHEVFYNKKLKPDSYTSDAVSVGGDDLSGLIMTLSLMNDCLTKPVLWHGEKFPQEWGSMLKRINKP